MTTIYIIRHGESLSNVKKTFTGHLDYELSPLGISQAKKLEKYFENISVDSVYSSDLSRSYNTVLGLAKMKGLEVISSKNFREVYGGKWEGEKFSDLYHNDPSYLFWKEDFAVAVCPEGESIKDVYNRVNAELDKVALDNPNKTIVIGMHATPVRVIMTRVLYNDLSKIAQVDWVPNCSVTQIFYEEGKYTLGKIGDISHLGEDITVLPKTV